MKKKVYFKSWDCIKSISPEDKEDILNILQKLDPNAKSKYQEISEEDKADAQWVFKLIDVLSLPNNWLFGLHDDYVFISKEVEFDPDMSPLIRKQFEIIGVRYQIYDGNKLATDFVVKDDNGLTYIVDALTPGEAETKDNTLTLQEMSKWYEDKVGKILECDEITPRAYFTKGKVVFLTKDDKQDCEVR